MPFIPEAAWPGTVQRYWYEPFSRIAILSVFDWPGLIKRVPVPGHESATGLSRAVQILKACGTEPWFVTLNTMIPRLTVLVDNVNLNSLGLPAVTVTVVTAAAPERDIAGDATRLHPARHATASRAALLIVPSS
jgi:hypothetical protein